MNDKFTHCSLQLLGGGLFVWLNPDSLSIIAIENGVDNQLVARLSEAKRLEQKMKKVEKMDKTVTRSRIENWIPQHIAAWEAGNAMMICTPLHPEVEVIFPAVHWQGREQVYSALQTQLAEWGTCRLHPRHILVDAAQLVAAIEWVSRVARPNETDCYELLGGTVIDFDETGLIRRWRTYLDPVRRRILPSLDAPLPGEGWSPCSDPGPAPTPAEMERVIHANAQAWSSHDLAQLQAVIHDDIILQPPWDYVAGRAALEAGGCIYFANYRDTLVTPHRLILDSTQPYLGVCEQTFACTNPDTGRHGEDHDFAFFEVVQGKLRYWRTYFDTSRSAQVVEKTVGFLSQRD